MLDAFQSRPSQGNVAGHSLFADSNGLLHGMFTSLVQASVSFAVRILSFNVARTRLPLEIASSFFYRASTAGEMATWDCAWRCRADTAMVAVVLCDRRMGDVFWNWVFAADLGDTNV
jgi:hypothetical protein